MSAVSDPIVAQLRRFIKCAEMTQTPIQAEQELKLIKLALRTALVGDDSPDLGMSMKSFAANKLLEVWLDPQLDARAIPVAPALQFLNDMTRDANSRLPIILSRAPLQSPESPRSVPQPLKRQRADTAGQSRPGPSGVNGASFDAVEDGSTSADSFTSAASDWEQASVEDPVFPPGRDRLRDVTEVSVHTLAI
jgi:hypothetical protein